MSKIKSMNSIQVIAKVFLCTKMFHFRHPCTESLPTIALKEVGGQFFRITSINRIFIYASFVISFCGVQSGTVAAVKNVSLINNAFVTGLNLSMSSRMGVFELSYGTEQKKTNAPLAMFGFELGKRFSIVNKLRLFVPANLSFGSIKEDVSELIAVSNDTGTFDAVLEIKKRYLQFGLIPQIQYAFPIEESKTFFYLSAGGGVNYVVFGEEERIKDEPIIITDSYLVQDDRTVSISLDLGAGIDIVLSRKRALSIVYGFKFWQPVNYDASRDLFPYSPIMYTETFFTHKVGLQFLIK